MSTIGGNNGGNNGGGGRDEPPRPPKGPDDGSPLNEDFFNSKGGRGKETAKKSDARLPISFRSDDGRREEEFQVDDQQQQQQQDEAITEEEEEEGDNKNEAEGGTISLARFTEKEETTAALMKRNPYMEVVNRLSPREIIGRFTATAHPRVQEAVKGTILGLIGNLPKLAFETTMVTTGQRLASLMFQLQMTGYMFKNAEYRMTLSNAVGSMDAVKNGRLLGSGEEEGDGVLDSKSKIMGKIKVKYGDVGITANNATDTSEGDVDQAQTEKDKEDSDGDDDAAAAVPQVDPLSSGYEVEVDAAAYMSELRSEVNRLRQELTIRKEEKEEAVRKDLLAYIRTLPEQEMRQLTGTISPDVLEAMKGLVNVVMEGIGDGQIRADTITEQSGEAMAQLCMWQLVVGYNLRELEVREEMKLFMDKGEEAGEDDGGIIMDD